MYTLRMRFRPAVFLGFVLIIGLASTEEDAETLSPFSVIDYRVNLWHLQLDAVVDPDTGLKFYFERLGIDYPRDNLTAIRETTLYEDWIYDYDVYRLYRRNMLACELFKTYISDLKYNYYDNVTELGYSACFNQCRSENEEYYLFLSSKLQDLTMKNPLLDVALYAPRNISAEKNISACTRLRDKRYRCDCFYKHYNVKVSPDFERSFGQILFEAREGRLNREDLELQYGIPMKLVGFLIIYHLKPDEMFTYLAWWAMSEGVVTTA